ncbi:MAG: hypothetical protein AB1772_13465 [Candidatus Zixiibacteriota bacterium]
MRIRNTYEYYTQPSTVETLWTGPGELHIIIATTESTTPVIVTYHDNTAASGNALLVFAIQSNAPMILILPAERPLRFSVGLTVTTPASTRAYSLLVA